MKGKIHIILADDNKYFLEGLKLVLLRYDEYVVIDECNNGRELLNSHLLPMANLILSDVDMPLMNGIEAVKRINFRFPHLPIIALTMHTDKIFLEDLITAGFRGYVHKPDVAQNLIMVIKEVLNNKFMFPDNLKISNI